MSILGVADISDRDLTYRKPITTESAIDYRNVTVNLRSGLGLGNLSAEIARSDDHTGFPITRMSKVTVIPIITR
jgi:hypothetical protein